MGGIRSGFCRSGQEESVPGANPLCRRRAPRAQRNPRPSGLGWGSCPDGSRVGCGALLGCGGSSRLGRGLCSRSGCLCGSRCLRGGRGFSWSRCFCGRFRSRCVRFGHRSGRSVLDTSRRRLSRDRGTGGIGGDSITCGCCAAGSTGRTRIAGAVRCVAHARAAGRLCAAHLVTRGAATAMSPALAGLGGLGDRQRDQRSDENDAQGADERTGHGESPKGALGRLTSSRGRDLE